ncbi:hypothetical protein A3N37_22425 [Enterobacter ludwigii]|nr:hypothetical protein A3N37_22425 [Enterobacter ludwigii]
MNGISRYSVMGKCRRRPRKRIAFSKDRGSEEEKEARMIALLCNLSEQDIWQLTAADYAQLLDAFNVFMLPPGKRPKED